MMNSENYNLYSNQVISSDIDFLCNLFLDKIDLFCDKNFLITGGTGLIGSYILLFLNKLVEKGIKLNIYSISRSQPNKKLQFNHVKYFTFDLSKSFEAVTVKFDYIIHLASPTSSKFFCDFPVDTIENIVNGTNNILHYIINQNPKARMVYLSTMEVYGDQPKGSYSENDFDGLDPYRLRSSYPEAKRLCECLCKAYTHQYSLNISVGRLTQTFGPGMQLDTDSRFFSSLINCAVSKKTMILYSKGETKRCYIYIADAVSAIFTILFKDTTCDVFNIANPDTFISIGDLSLNMSKKFNFKLEYKLNDVHNIVFCKTHELNLNVNKLKKLGWLPYYLLNEGIDRTVLFYKNSK